jgi:hypothetical protein
MNVAGRSGKIDVRLLGQWLGRHADRIVDLDGGDFVALKMAGLLHGNRQWKVSRRRIKTMVACK